MTTQPRHARHHRFNTVHAAAVLAAIGLFLAAVFLLVPSPGPVPSGAPGPQVLRPPAASQQITVQPDHAVMRAAMHRAHLAHLAEEHKRHLKRLRLHRLHELHEERVYY